nr:uncharacterized protein LOC128692903 [Cherax quadricarinatus]XP_053638195.1 uncharacterized protein LOC128692903 [Cherax quadricarinatus]XP_053638196.1 uncharacterized protein LOC128692903 [Cherax quadricarinatus]XP_053638197.1 uncharacterized protein LOC128692903 [Cherax quadricarinatus]XP_053638199.1 uncharacterized protein LOC128692903 [Cherax quadricarinatus]XP_053638200.1 uncharacterized protein LOC128692903 [Cherax quadricarinatus]
MPTTKSPQQTCNTTLFIFANIQGLKPSTNNKIPFISGLLEESNSLFAAFTETHAKDYFDSEIWIPGYNLFKCDRKNRQQGGVDLYIKESLICTEILNTTNDVVEVLTIKIENQNLVIVLVYKPPDATSQQLKEQLSKIDSCLDNFPAPSPNILLLGDFNLRHTKWKNIANNVVAEIIPGGSSDERSHTQELLNFCNKHTLSQQIVEPTRLENTLDLIFTNNEDLVRNITISKTTNSDHNLIEVQTCMHRSPDQHNAFSYEGTFTKSNFNNKNIIWDQVNYALNETCWEDILNYMNPNQCLEKITLLVAEVCSRYIPIRQKKRRSKLERERCSLYRRRRRIIELLKNARLSDTRKVVLTREVENIELKLKDSYRIQERQEELKPINEIERNSKYFFSYAKNKSKTTSSIGPLLRQDGSYTDDNKEMSEILKLQYDSVFSEPLTSLKIDDPM